MKKKTIQTALAPVFAFLSPMKAYATVLRPDAQPSDFDALTLTDAPGFILGVSFWIVRLIGIILIIAGIYNYAMAKKDGDADEITTGIVKTCVGTLFLVLPRILKALGVITF